MPGIAIGAGLNANTQRAGVGALRSFFGASDTGFLLDGMRASILFQDTAATTPVAANSDPVGRANDQSGKGSNGVQATGTKRPFWFTNSGKPYIKGDAVDDSLDLSWVPTTAGCIAFAGRPVANGEVLWGAKATADRCYFGMTGDGRIGGGIGLQSSNSIYGPSDTSCLGVDITAVLTWNGTTVELWRDGVKIYSGAQSGAVSQVLYGVSLCALNNQGVIGASTTARFYAAMGISRVPTAPEIALITSQLQGTYQ